MKGKGTRPKSSDNIKGILVGGAASTDLQVLSCDSTSVTIQGIASVNVTKGSFLIKIGDDGDMENCFSCTPLFRKVLSVSVAPASGTLTLMTAFATMGDLFDQTILNQTFKSQLIEPLAGCSHSGVAGGTKILRGEESTSKSKPVAIEGNRPTAPTSAVFSAAAAGSTCDPLWQLKNPDGRCTHTNCFVGKTGDPVDCFKCKNTCNNGCGEANNPYLNTDGNFILFDFGPACCNHDFCYSSNTNTKWTCDSTFYKQMTSQCNPFSKSIPLVRRIGLLNPQVRGACDMIAAGFFLGVIFFGNEAQRTAQAEQKEYEKEDVCIAKCPTTQESGGQGVTTLTINLLKTSGTFQVSYDMYQIPDALSIFYEGKPIFSTGGGVSGAASTFVTFSGTSTKIQVTINAPLSGTAWDVFVGCPTSP